jgi:tetratricopeptide (TPR) repeat protein
MTDEAIRSASADPTLLWYMGGPFQIASAQGRAGDRTAVTGTLRDLLRIATALPDEALKVQALQNVASALAEIGDRADAGNVLRTALQVADAIRKDSDRAFALAEIALAQIEMGERKDASASLGKALQSLLATGDDAERADKVLSRISQAQAEVADVSGATQAAAGIRDPLLKAEAFLRVAAILLRAGTGVPTQPILRQAAAAAPQVQDRHERDYILNRVGCLLARAGDMPAALQAIGGRGGSAEVDALVDIGVVQAELGDRVAARATLQRAMRIAARIPDHEEERSGAIEATAQGTVQIGDVKSALSWASGQGSPRLKLWALVGVAKGLAFGIVEMLEPDMVDRPLTLRAGYGCPLSEG